MRMRKMSGAWESFTRSRMATLAVNALLLGSGPSGCRAAAAASAGAGWSNPRASVLRVLSSAAALPHNLGRATQASPAAAAGGGGLFGRHSGGAQEAHACETKLSSGEEARWRRARRGGAGAADVNMHTRVAGRCARRGIGRPAGMARAEEAERPRKGGFLRRVLGVRVALAATGGEQAGGAEEAAVRGSDSVGGGMGQWVKRLQGRSTASCEQTAQEQQLQQPRRQRQEGGSVYTRTAAVLTAAVRMPSSAGSVAAAAVSATPSPSPVPSYLRWPESAAEPEDAESADFRDKKHSRKALPLGVGGRAGRPSSGKEAAATSPEKEGSLEAAKSSRGGGGAGAVSLTFKEAMFAGAVSRSIAQVRR